MDEKVTSNEKKLTSNEQKVTRNEQKVTRNEQKLTRSEQKRTSNEQKVASNDLRAKRSASDLILLYAIKLQCALLMKIKEILKNDGITTYPYRTNLLFLKYFEDQDTPNSIEELKNVYKEFTENDKL